MNRPTERHFLRIRVGKQWFGVPVANVIEVVPLVDLAEMPDAQAGTLGLMTLRDEVMPVIDLRVRFNAPYAHLTLQHLIVALRVDEKRAAILVDEVDAVMSVPDEAVHATEDSPLVWGAAQQDDMLLLLLAVENLFPEDGPA